MHAFEIRKCFAEMQRRGWSVLMAYELTVAHTAHYWKASRFWAAKYVTDVISN